MNARIKLSLLSLTLLAAACSADMGGGEDVDDGTDALRRIPAAEAGEPVGVGPLRGRPLGPLTPVPRKAPRVVARSASGSTLTVRFDRAIAAGELPLDEVEVLVVRPSGGGFVKKDLAANAALSSDKTTLSIALTEPVRGGEIYYPRGAWRPCGAITATHACKERPARLGEIVARSARSSALDLAVAPTNGQIAMFSSLAAVPTPETSIMLAEPPLPEQGSFRVKSVTPEDLSTTAERKTERVVVTFEGGTIDCAKTGRGKAAFHLHSVDPDVFDQQSMYEDPAAPTPTSGGFRGSLRCEEDENRIVFTTPGVLLGDAWFQIELNAWSKEGNFMGDKVLEFKTKRPGIQVLATRIENHYGGDNTCDDDLIGKNFCDVYVTTAIATAGGGQPSRVPEQGDFGNMRYFPDDATNGKRDLRPNRVLYANANPIDEVLEMKMWAVDADDDSTWKKVFETAGKIANAMASALAPIKPEAGAISSGVAAGFVGLAELIPTNEDDLLGSGRFIVTAEHQRWYTQASSPIVLELSKNAPNRGPVKVFVRTEELPRSWRPQPRID